MLINEIIESEYIRQTLKQFFVQYGEAEVVNDVINVDGSIKLQQKCWSLPIKFGKVNGNVDFRSMALRSLEGCPKEINGRFYISGNPISSLEGGPSIVSDDYVCYSCLLNSLKGAPEIVGAFNCSQNNLASFKDGPKIVNGSFLAANNEHLTSLNGLPKEINGDIAISIHENLPLLRLLFVKKLKKIRFYCDPALMAHDDMININNIISKYIGQGKGGALSCAAELTKAGYKGNARL